jgi:23S rRNA (adenine-N6)-dimethyltransferase
LLSAAVIVEWRLAEKRAAVWPSTRLGVEWSAWFRLELVRRLPRCCFAPPPSVDAAVLRAARRDEPLVAVEEAARYRRFVDRGFHDGLGSVVPPRTLKRLASDLGFDRHAAPRDLDPPQWAAVYRHMRRG